MRSSSISISIFTVLLLSAAAFGQTNYSTYSNARFGYSIQYPKDLLAPQTEADNGDGRVFFSKDKKVEMRVWGNYNALFHSIREDYREALKMYAGVTYKTLLTNGYVVSGIGKNVVYYRKTLYGKKEDVDCFYTFFITYPKSRRDIYDPIVRKIAASFRFD